MDPLSIISVDASATDLLCTSLSTRLVPNTNDGFSESSSSIVLDESCIIEVLGETLTAKQFKYMIQAFKKAHPEAMI